MRGRDAAGHFTSGLSPDRGHGRVVATSGTEMLADIRSSIMDAANIPVRMRDNAGRRWRTVSLFELMVRRLASGQTSRRRSVVPFIRLVVRAATEPVPPEMLTNAEPPDPRLLAASQVLNAAMADGSDHEIDDALTRYMAVLRSGARRGLPA